MSLVAYGSSDEESDASDSEEAQNSGVSRDVAATDHQDDAKELSFTKGAIEPAEKKGLFLPPPKQTNEISNSAGRKTGLSSLLPKPQNTGTNSFENEITTDQNTTLGNKPSFSLEGMAGNDGDDEILEIEEEYEPLIKRAKRVTSSEADDKPKSVGSLFSLLPAPWQAASTWQKGGEHEKKASSKGSRAEDRKRKQPIKIAIPSAPKTDSDEEDDMETAKKVVAPSKEVSGLKLLLPKPKHSITLKADNPNKPAVKLASRPLIPHTLTKKAAVRAEKKPQKSTKKNQGEDAISDDEDEPVSFFTFSEKSEDTTPDKNIETLDTKLSSVKSNESYKLEVKSAPVSSLPGAEMTSTATTFQSSKKHFNEIAPSPAMEEPSAQASFGSEESINPGELETRTYYYDQQPEQPQQYGSYSANDYENYKYDSSSTSVDQPYYNQGAETYTYTYPTGMAEQAQNQPQETDIDLEKLQRLKGRKNRHEEINIVDVNAADQIGNSAEMVAKYGTEEVAHQPSRKKKDMPTAQQRRKHQITYLAFQAKEREFELRQQWSANRQTRRQTQSKYGF